jgi:hypothetical protein
VSWIEPAALAQLPTTGDLSEIVAAAQRLLLS